ncbi:MAG: hypothetical protein D6717_14260 [Gammaproteobacteria bacterium]|nr:MAG: hypothetical protein D6717_14260 [Gammaproteobacteria bacterium]
MDEFLLRAWLAGLAVATVSGGLGVFVVWRRLAYFGDSLSHSALLGIAMGLLLGINTTLPLLAVCMAVAVLIVWLRGQRRFSTDTVLGILAHAALSVGLVAVSLVEGLRMDLMAWLFGDILAVNASDLLFILLGSGVVLALLGVLWTPLLRITLDEDLARVEGVPVTAVNLGFMLLMAMVVALAMKLVGVLLITALLIIPAATARYLARSPELMAVLAAVLGMLAVSAGLYGSLQWDTPAGPSVVVAASLVFLLVSLLLGRRHVP